MLQRCDDSAQEALGHRDHFDPANGIRHYLVSPTTSVDRPKAIRQNFVDSVDTLTIHREMSGAG